MLDEDGAEPGARESRMLRQGHVHSRIEEEEEEEDDDSRAKAADSPEMLSAKAPELMKASA